MTAPPARHRLDQPGTPVWAIAVSTLWVSVSVLSVAGLVRGLW